MEKFNATDINIGIVTDLMKRKVITAEESLLLYLRGIYITKGKSLRGIIFTKNENIGTDILNPMLEYPIFPVEDIRERAIGISYYKSLEPLLTSYELGVFSYQDLNNFLNEVLLNKKWLKENMELFGFRKIGNAKYFRLFDEHLNAQTKFPTELGEIISDVQDLNGFSLSRKEQKIYLTR